MLQRRGFNGSCVRCIKCHSVVVLTGTDARAVRPYGAGSQFDTTGGRTAICRAAREYLVGGRPLYQMLQRRGFNQDGRMNDRYRSGAVRSLRFWYLCGDDRGDKNIAKRFCRQNFYTYLFIYWTDYVTEYTR